jgi:hypothetical protein
VAEISASWQHWTFIIYQFYVFFGLFQFLFHCFGSIETPKHAVSILNRNNRNKRLVSDSVETSFGSIFRLFRIETSFVGHPNIDSN